MAEVIELDVDDDDLDSLKRLFVRDCLEPESGETFEAEVLEHGNIDRALVAACINEMVIKIIQAQVMAAKDD